MTRTQRGFRVDPRVRCAVRRGRIATGPWTVALAAALAAQAAPAQNGAPGHDCIGANQRAAAFAALAEFVATHGPLSQAPGGQVDNGAPPYAFYPHGGSVTADLMPSALVDLDLS